MVLTAILAISTTILAVMSIANYVEDDSNDTYITTISGSILLIDEFEQRDISKYYIDKSNIYHNSTAIDDPDPEFVKKLRILNEAKKLYDGRDYIKTVGLLDSILDLNPEDEEALEFKGNSYFKINDVARAIFYYEKALDENPDNVPVLHNLALSYSIVNKSEKALQTYDKILDIDPTHVSTLNNIANLHVRSNNAELARTFYERALTNSETYLPTLNNFAILSVLTGDVGKGSELLNKIPNGTEMPPPMQESMEWVKLSLDKNKTEFSSTIDESLRKNHLELKTILAIYDGVKIAMIEQEVNFEQNFNDAEELLGIAKEHYEVREYELAEFFFLLLLEDHPEFIVAMLGVANVYSDTTEYGKAIKQYNVILEQNSEHVLALNGLATSYLGSGQHTQAKKIFDRVLEIDADNYNAVIGLGNVDQSQGNYNFAMAYYDQVLDVNSDHINANKGAGFTCYLVKEFECAKEHFNRIIAIDEFDFHANSNMALIHFEEDNEDEANKYLEKIEISKKRAVTLMMRPATDFMDSGNFAMAKPIINRVLSIDSENEDALKYKKMINEAK